MKGVELASQKSYFHELCELFSRQLKRPDSKEEYKNPACTADTFPEAHDNEMCFMPQIDMPGKELWRQVPTGIISLLSLNPCHQHPDPGAWARVSPLHRSLVQGSSDSELTKAKPGLGTSQEKSEFSQNLLVGVSPREGLLRVSLPACRHRGLGRRLTHCRLVQWLLEKGRMNAEATIKASSEVVLQLSGNNLDSYSCHHLARASFLISFGSSRCHSTKGELALRSTLCLT